MEDPPGALEAEVPAFIDRIVGEWYEAEDAQRFRDGLATLEESTKQEFGEGFASISNDNRTTLIDRLDSRLTTLVNEASAADEAGTTYKGEPPQNHFFYQMKWLTLTGYFTSEVGMTETLHFKMIPRLRSERSMREAPTGWAAKELTERGLRTLYTGRRPTGIYLPRFRNVDENHPDFLRGYMADQAAEMLEVAGCTDVSVFHEDNPPGKTIHEMGTARMGRDPGTSVLNGNNQAHDVPNLFVTDGSCMTSFSNQNPSLTYMALTARACAYAVES